MLQNFPVEGSQWMRILYIPFIAKEHTKRVGMMKRIKEEGEQREWPSEHSQTELTLCSCTKLFHLGNTRCELQ